MSAPSLKFINSNYHSQVFLLYFAIFLFAGCNLIEIGDKGALKGLRQLFATAGNIQGLFLC